MTEHVVLRHRHPGLENINQLAAYQASGGFEAYRTVVTSMTQQAVIDLI